MTLIGADGGVIDQVGFAYDPRPDAGGKLQAITNDDIGLTYVTDGPLVTDLAMTGAVSGSIHRDYDSRFRLATESVDGGASIAYHYDKDGLLTSLVATAPQAGGGAPVVSSFDLQRSATTEFASGGTMTVGGAMILPRKGRACERRPLTRAWWC